MKKEAIALVLSLAAFPARAQEPGGFYAGLSIGSATSNACDGVTIGLSCSDGVTNGKIFAGFQFHPNFAIEAGLTPTLMKANASAINAFAPASFTAEISSRAVDFTLVPSAPLGSSAVVYAKVGFYAAETEQTSAVNIGPVPCCVRVVGGNNKTEESNVGLTYGVGLGWNFTRQFMVRGDYQRYQGVGGGNLKELDVDTLNLGALYRF